MPRQSASCSPASGWDAAVHAKAASRFGRPLAIWSSGFFLALEQHRPNDDGALKGRAQVGVHADQVQ